MSTSNTVKSTSVSKFTEESIINDVLTNLLSNATS